MKRLTIVVVFLLIRDMAPAQMSVDILHYKFELTLNNHDDTIRGCAEIKLRFLQSVPSVSLDLNLQNNMGLGMKVDRVAGFQKQLNYTAKNDKVNIILARQSNVNDS